MDAVSLDVVRAERGRRLFLADGRGVLTEADAAAYVNERGFVHLFAPPRLPWPSVSDAEIRASGKLQTFSHVVWRWKNTLPAAKLCAYGHFLRQRGLFLSWQLFPAFRRLWGLRDPVAQILESDAVTPMARQMLQVVAVQGPIRSRDLRREVEALAGRNRRTYNAALHELQARCLITVVGGSLKGFTMHDWDLLERHAPPEALALDMPESEARTRLLRQVVANAPYCTVREIGLLLRWERDRVAATLEELKEMGVLTEHAPEGQKDLGYRVVGDFGNDAGT